MVDDIGMELKGLTKEAEYSLLAHGTTTAHCLVEHDGTGIIASVANSIKVIGAEAKGLGTTTGLPIAFKANGIVPVATYEKVEVGRNIKAGPGGLAVRMLDASLVSTALGGGEYTTIDGVTFGNQPANDTVDIKSSSASDVTQSATVYGWTQAGAMGSEVIGPLTGVTPVLGVTAWARIHAIVLSAATVGNITLEEHSALADITIVTAAALSKGRLTASDSRAYCGKIGVVASGACTKYVGIRGVSLTGTVVSEEIQMNGATIVPSVLEYSKITYLDYGDVATGTTISATTRAAEDDENVKVGIALTGVTTASEIQVALK